MADPNPNLAALSLSDSDDDHLFDTPAARKPSSSNAHNTTTTPAPQPYTTPEDRDAALRAELSNIRTINTVIESIVSSLHTARANMDVRPFSLRSFPPSPPISTLPTPPIFSPLLLITLLQTVQTTLHSTSSLLQTYTRILSQTEHVHRLILDPSWNGASQDLLDVQEEELARQQAAERKAVEERERREQAARRVEEERRREAEKEKSVGRGRGRGVGRGRIGAAGTGTSYVGVGGQAGTGRGTVGRRGSVGRERGSGIGRGVRGRARGAGS